MTKKDFFKNLKQELELEADIDGAINFKELDEWDSMTAMILIGYVSGEFNVTLTADDLEELTTLDSVVTKIGEDKFK
jgi:acyl carrier protein